MNKVVRTSSTNDTIEEGEKFAQVLKKGDVIVLKGDLGAGKTHFVKGVALGLGSENLVNSPTFTILNVYEGKLPIYHFDMYRLSSKEEAEELGFEEYFDHDRNDGVAIVEWPEQVEGLIIPNYIIKIKKIDDNCRELSIRSNK